MQRLYHGGYVGYEFVDLIGITGRIRGQIMAVKAERVILNYYLRK